MTEKSIQSKIYLNWKENPGADEKCFNLKFNTFKDKKIPFSIIEINPSHKSNGIVFILYNIDLWYIPFLTKKKKSPNYPRK